MERGIIFVAGTYGVGKSTLCDKLSERLNIPSYSSGDLISEINGETYGANKVVKDKTANQNILITAVKRKLSLNPVFMLAGHFCIFNKSGEVERLPEFVYKEMPISKLILLETDVNTIINNIKSRDNKLYNLDAIKSLVLTERKQAEIISGQLNLPLYVHKMNFDQTDVDKISVIIQGSVS